MTLPISIPSNEQPSPMILPDRLSSFGSNSSGKSNSSTVIISKLPERPSVLTNKMSPNNAIPIDPNAPEPPLILANTKLSSIRHSSVSSPRRDSSSSTPALSNSTSMTCSSNITPLMSPTKNSGNISPSQLVQATEVLDESKKLFESLSPADKYLLFLREEVGMTDWPYIAQAMMDKGFEVDERTLRLRYFTVKRNVDAKLKLAINAVRATQSDIDYYLNFGVCQDRCFGSSNKKRNSSVRDLTADEEEQVNALAASLRATGMK